MGSKENHNSIVHSEFITLAWKNMASIKSARKLSRETNQAAKNYYQLTFIDDMNEEDEEVVVGESNDNQHNEDNDSVHNSKFAFDELHFKLFPRQKVIFWQFLKLQK